MKIALITGASQGIGAAIADKLNVKKIKVILVSRSKSKLKTFQKNLKCPKNSLIISKDLRLLSACNSIAKKIKKLDYLINCLLYTSPSPRDLARSRMPSSA